MGKDGHGRVQMYGLGFSLNIIWEVTSTLVTENQDENIDAMHIGNSTLRSEIQQLRGALSSIRNKEVRFLSFFLVLIKQKFSLSDFMDE